MTGESSRSDRPDQHSRLPAEWTTLAIVLLILAGLAGSLLWNAWQPRQPATFDVQPQLSGVEQRNGIYYLPVVVRNTGRATAEDVLVRVSLIERDEPVEEVELTFRFVAGGEQAEGVAAFQQDPRNGTIEAGVASFLKP